MLYPAVGPKRDIYIYILRVSFERIVKEIKEYFNTLKLTKLLIRKQSKSRKLVEQIWLRIYELCSIKMASSQVKYQIYNYIDKKVQPRETLQYSNYTNQSHNFQNRAYGLYQSEQNEHNRSDSSSSPPKIGEVNPFQVCLTMVPRTIIVSSRSLMMSF